MKEQKKAKNLAFTTAENKNCENISEDTVEKVKNLIAPKTPEQEGDAKAPKEDSTTKGMTIITKTWNKLDQATMHGELPYNVMFGTDICGPGPKKIKDPEASKPNNWVNQAKLNNFKDEYANLIATKTHEQEGDTKVAEDTDLQNLQKEAQSLTIITARVEEQQNATNLIALKIPEQDGDTKVWEETDLQDLQEEAQGPTITNAREEEQQKVENLIAPKTLEQEGDAKVPEKTLRTRIPTCRTCRRRPRA